MVHIAFCAELYRKQLDAGRRFLHEHPAGATSWQTGIVQDLMKEPGVETVVGHMCSQGMDVDGQKVLKPTRWMTNAEEVAK